MDDGIGEADSSLSYDTHLTKTKSICSDDESLKTLTVLSTESNTETKTTPQISPELRAVDKFYSAQTSHDDELAEPFDTITVNENGLLLLHDSHPEYLNLIRLQLENHELTQWKCQLQQRIQNERAEVIRLKAILNSRSNSEPIEHDYVSNIPDDGSYERIVTHYVRENTQLEQKKNNLAKEIFEENKELIQLQVELAIRKFQI